MRAGGRWAWLNAYGDVDGDRDFDFADITACVARATSMPQLAGVIIKRGMTEAQRAFSAAAVPWATEAYVYPNDPAREGRTLADDVVRGARFAVVDAEVEWERLDGKPMQQLINAFRLYAPRGAELYASLDTRGGRTTLPFQRVLIANTVAVMPQIYPSAFRPSMPPGAVAQAFRDCLDGADFQGKPVLPTIQTYDNIGATAVREQLAEVQRRGFAGCQAYTIGHATDQEWAAFARPQEDEMTEDERNKLNFTFAALSVLAGQVQDQRDALVGTTNGVTFLKAVVGDLWGKVAGLPASELPEEFAEALRAITAAENAIAEAARKQQEFEEKFAAIGRAVAGGGA